MHLGKFTYARFGNEVWARDDHGCWCRHDMRDYSKGTEATNSSYAHGQTLLHNNDKPLLHIYTIISLDDGIAAIRVPTHELQRSEVRRLLDP